MATDKQTPHAEVQAEAEAIIETARGNRLLARDLIEEWRKDPAFVAAEHDAAVDELEALIAEAVAWARAERARDGLLSEAEVFDPLEARYAAAEKARALRQDIAARGEAFPWHVLKGYRDTGRR